MYVRVRDNYKNKDGDNSIMNNRINQGIVKDMLGCTRVVAADNITSNGHLIPMGTKGILMSQNIKHGSQVEALVKFDGFPNDVYTKIKHIKCEL